MGHTCKCHRRDPLVYLLLTRVWYPVARDAQSALLQIQLFKKGCVAAHKPDPDLRPPETRPPARAAAPVDSDPPRLIRRNRKIHLYSCIMTLCVCSLESEWAVNLVGPDCWCCHCKCPHPHWTYHTVRNKHKEIWKAKLKTLTTWSLAGMGHN